MMTANDKGEGCWSLAPEYEHRRLKLIIADGSPQYLDTVRTVLDFHNIVDLLGRAANFQETIQLAASLLPDLVLMDFEMPAAMVAIAAIVTAAPDVLIVGIFNASIPLHTPGLILSVNAFIDKARLCNDLLPALHALIHCRPAPISLSVLSHFHPETERQGPNCPLN